MAYSNAAAPAGGAGSDSTNATFRTALALYVGAFLAGLVATGAAPSIDSTATLAGSAVAAFLLGTGVGIGLAGRVRGLPSRLGRTWMRKLALCCGALPFVAVIVASVLWSLESQVGLAALGSSFAVVISGLVLAQVAENGYVDAVTDGDDPVASRRWHWSPSGSRKLDLGQFLLIVTGSLLGVGDALADDWWTAIVWIGSVVGIAVTNIAEGRWVRWLPGVRTEPATVRVYEHGFATKRPFRRQFVPWSAISHVRLRNDELVVDRGTFGHRFDRDDLEDADALFEAIDRQRSTRDDGRS